MTRPDFLKLLSLNAGSLLLGSCASGPQAAGEKVSRNVAFAAPGGHELRMDLYVPPSSGKVPVVMWIFGGSWKMGSKSFHVAVRDLTKYGIAVASIEYRLSGTATYPAQIDDCRAALNWLRKNGPQYGIDPSRIGVSGESAGGHLAALLGVTEGAGRVRGVFALYPATDLVGLAQMYPNPFMPNDVERMLGGRIDQVQARAREASPVDRITSSAPPFLIMHGTLDMVVPIRQSEVFSQRLHGAGVQCQLVEKPGYPHGFSLSGAEMAQVGHFFQRHFSMQES